MSSFHVHVSAGIELIISNDELQKLLAAQLKAAQDDEMLLVTELDQTQATTMAYLVTVTSLGWEAIGHKEGDRDPVHYVMREDQLIAFENLVCDY